MNIRRYAKYLGICMGSLLLIFIFIFFLFFYPLKYTKTIKKHCLNYNVDSALVASIINAESSFNKNAVSGAGAVGLMQILPKTAQWICEKESREYKIDYLTDIDFNIMIGTYYINYLINKFEVLDTAICAYNAGEGVVSEWLNNNEYSTDKKSLKMVPYKETKNYLTKVKTGINVYRLRI